MSDSEETIVRQHLGTRIQRVLVVHGTNPDGESVRRVYVIYDQARGDLTAREMSDTTDALWTDALRRGIKSAPVTSFVSSEDAAGVYAAQ